MSRRRDWSQLTRKSPIPPRAARLSMRNSREARRSRRMSPPKIPLLPTQWTIAGKAIPKVDARAFVTGKHQYTTDLRPAGLLYGRVLRPPSFGATLTSCDDNAAKAMTGVVVVRDGDFVGVAAPSAHEAQRALDAIHAQWKEVPQISSKEIFSYLKQNAAAKSEDRFRKQEGSVEEGLAGA